MPVLQAIRSIYIDNLIRALPQANNPQQRTGYSHYLRQMDISRRMQSCLPSIQKYEIHPPVIDRFNGSDNRLNGAKGSAEKKNTNLQLY